VADEVHIGVHGPRRGQAFFGIVLILGGVVLLLNQFGVLSGLVWHDLWPYVIIALGAAMAVTAGYAERVGTGVSFVGFGLWWLAAVHHWHGLTWRTSWPLALVALGAGSVTHAIAAWFLPDRPRIRVRVARRREHEV
jgi:cell wall-active antibiotic response 4TMS protein YvqF